MRNWKSLLNQDATDWLLEESNPSVRYFALRWLLDKSERDKDVVTARQAIGQSAPIRRIIERRRCRIPGRSGAGAVLNDELDREGR